MRLRRDKAWEISVTLGIDEGGKQRRRYKTIHGSKAQALDELDRLLREVGRGNHVYSGHVVAELIREWLQMAELADTTRYDYERVIRDHLPHELARMKAAKVQPFDLDRTYKELQRAGVGLHRIRRLHSILRSAFAQAVRWKWVQWNPATDASPPRVKKAEIRPPAPANVKTALGVAGKLKSNGLALAVWLRVAAATGARRGEICGLRWEDVEEGCVWIRRSVAYTPKTGLTVKDTKTHQVRRVPLDTSTLAAIEAHRHEVEDLDRAKPDCYMFSDAIDGSTPWRPDSTSRKVRLVSGGTIHPHGLRHFVATQLTAAGVDPRTIAERLGHERVSTTLDMYSHWAEGTGRTAADLMGDILG